MSTTPILGRKNDYAALGTVDHAELNALVADLEWLAGAVVTVDLTGSADVTLSAAQYDARVLLLIGVLGASINLILPTNRAWIIANGTTGSTYTVTAKTAAGTGVALQQGETALLAGDGTNIVRGPASSGVNSDITRLRSLESGTATESGGAATVDKQTGIVTTSSLTTAAGADFTLTLTSALISATSKVFLSIYSGTNTTTPVYVSDVKPGSGSVVIKIRNAHASAALNGTLKVSFFVIP